MARSFADVRKVDIMSAQGLSDYEVARRSGVPRSTVQRWRRGNRIARDQRDDLGESDWSPLDPGAYSYLLGAYLGDGHITVVSQRSASLVITLDSSYPRIVAEVQQAVAAVFPGVRVHHYLRNSGSVTAVQANHPALPFAFPQHGPGRKHTRSIVLREWQREVTQAHPKKLLRGLIHSDGCRTVNRFKTKLPSGRVAEYEYPRYFFSNLSAHIRAIFCEHCELLGVRWTQSNSRNISVSHRKSVALLDEFIGPKA